MRNIFAPLLHQSEYIGIAGNGVVAARSVIFAIDLNAPKSNGRITIRSGVTTFQHNTNDRDINFDKINDENSDRFNEITYYGAG